MQLTRFIPLLLCATAAVVPVRAASPASVTLANTTFGEYNVLTMELGGTTQGSGYDHLSITGTAALGGTLEVAFVDGFTPSGGDSFDLLDGSTTGSFAAVNLPPLSGGLTWDTSRLATDGIITVGTPLTAIETWRQTHFGSSANSGNGADTFDSDKDGIVNLIEYAFGLNPTLASSLQLPAVQRSGGAFFYDFTEPAGISGITYGAEWSATLQAADWHAIPDTASPPRHLFSVPTGGNDRLFLRLRITNP